MGPLEIGALGFGALFVLMVLQVPILFRPLFFGLQGGLQRGLLVERGKQQEFADEKSHDQQPKHPLFHNHGWGWFPPFRHRRQTPNARVPAFFWFCPVCCCNISMSLLLRQVYERINHEPETGE